MLSERYVPISVCLYGYCLKDPVKFGDLLRGYGSVGNMIGKTLGATIKAGTLFASGYIQNAIGTPRIKTG